MKNLNYHLLVKEDQMIKHFHLLIELKNNNNNNNLLLLIKQKL